MKFLKNYTANTIFVFLFYIFQPALINAQTGTWSLINPAPDPSGGGLLLLTDGSVMVKTEAGNGGQGNGTIWDKLTPDIHGSYVNGTWTQLAPMHNDRLYFSSQVMPDGRVYVAGGEYGTGGNKGEVYNPDSNTWTRCGSLPNSSYDIYDGNSEILPDGKILEGPQIGPSNHSEDILIYNPSTNLYSIGPNSLGSHDESAWLKLPDSSILYVNINSRNSERYIPSLNKWVNDGHVPVSLYDSQLEEMGAGLLLPDGRGFFLGSTGHTAYYTPTGDTNKGTWAAGPDIPNGLGTPDAPAAMMINGKILCAVAPAATYNPPTYFYEFDYLSNTFTLITNYFPGTNSNTSHDPSYYFDMLDLPDGTVMLATQGSNNYYVYNPVGSQLSAGTPTIDNISAINCTNFKITGKLFNGISEGAAYGDDWQMETNYPIVRLTMGANVYYAKSTNWNRIGAVRTGNLEDTAYFALPPGFPGGTDTVSVSVIANGFISRPDTIYLSLPSVSVNSNFTGCFGDSSGNATATVTNATGPYTYSWSNGTTTVSSVNPTGAVLSAGTYTVYVTDGSGCTASCPFTITQPGLLSTSPIVTNVTCNGDHNGSANANASGGITPYTYSWSFGASTASVSNLGVGTYTINLTDNNGCTASSVITITQPDILSAFANVTSNEICYQGREGSVSASATGGTQPYTYQWSNSITGTIQSGLSAGSYTLTVTDSNSCSSSVAATITQPNPLTITTSFVNATSGCNGSASVSVSGGTSPYFYLWTGGQNADSITDQCVGVYCCTVTDYNGCSNLACVSISKATGINNITQNNGVVIYPNPTGGEFTIQLSATPQNIASRLEIYDVLGQKLMSKEMKTTTEKVNLNGQPDGVYLLRILSADGNLIDEQRIVKMQ